MDSAIVSHKLPTLRPSRPAINQLILGGRWGEVQREEALKTVHAALEQGIGWLDTSPAEETSEAIIGEALSQWSGPMPRISTKVGMRSKEQEGDLQYDYSIIMMRRSLLNSLRLLKRDSIDILFIEDPENIPESDIAPLLEALSRLQYEGLVQTLGIGGNPPAYWLPYITEDVFPVVMGYNQVNAATLDAYQRTLPALKEKKITYIAGSPLHNGLLGRRFEEWRQERPSWISKAQVLRAHRLSLLAKKVGIPPAELALRFLFSINELDYWAIGPTNQNELHQSLKAWSEGPLDQGLFEDICERILY